MIAFDSDVICGKIPHECAVLCLVTQSCLTLCDPMDCSPPGSSVHVILQARILEWVAILGHTGPEVMKPDYLNNGPGAEVYAFLSPWSQLFISSFELVTNGLNKSKFLFS